MLEIEIKVRIGKAADVSSRLRALGGYVATERTLEDDVLFDFPDRRLTEAGSLLRLRRRADGAWLTWKEKVPSDLHAKVRREVETSVEDPAALRSILEGLGMSPIWRYQKYRTSYRLGRLHALLDELPIGNFLELEGDKAEIDRWAGALGLSPGDYVIETYRDLYEDWCGEHRRELGDMTFEGAQA